jgi:hypothetical protein
VSGIFSFWDGKLAAQTAMNANPVRNVKIGQNQYSGFNKTGVVDLSSVPADYTYDSKATSASVLKALQAVTDKAFGKDTYLFSWQDKIFNLRKAGTYLAIAKCKNYNTGVDVLYYEVTVLPKKK